MRVRINKNNNPEFNLNDVCFALGYIKESKGKLYLRKDLIENICETIDITGLSVGDNEIRITKEMDFNDIWILEESLYDFILESRTKNARGFRKWITNDILPTVRKTGGYIANEDLFIDTYLPFADGTTRDLFKTTLLTVRKQNELIQFQNKQIQEKDKEIEYKENVIIGLVDEISLAEKRQILNRVVRRCKNYQERWSELYKQFEMKYHINLSCRLESYNSEHKPKLKNKLDYIDKVMNKVPDLYEIACKLYESDVKELIKEMYKLQHSEQKENDLSIEQAN